MRERRVEFSPEARMDLEALYDWVADRASAAVAIGYLDRTEAFCRRLGMGHEPGTLRPDIRSGLRIVGFERRLTVAFTVDEETVTILRVFGTGRDWESAL